MVAYKLYYSSETSKKEFKAKGEITDDSYKLVDITCPLTGNKFKSRAKFWDHIKELKLDPENMTYDRVVEESTGDNVSLLLDKSYLSELWYNYFENTSSMKKKSLENLLGHITLELYIILLKVFRGDTDINEVLNEGSEESEEGVKEESEEEVKEEMEEEEGETVEEMVIDVINTGLNKIYNMDCYDYLCKLPDQHIDSIILDPPYYEVVKESWDNQWKTFNDYLDWFTPIIKELNRVSKYSCSCFVFGFPHQLSYLLPLFEKEGFKYRQYICVSKGLQAVAGRTSQKLKMFPTASEYILYFYKDATPIIKKFLQDKQIESGLSGNDINEYLGKASNGGGTWSTIAGKRQQNIQNPTREDWNKLEKLFGGFNIKYDDYIYKFNLPNGLTDVWTDINFNDRKYKKLWNEKYNEKCSHPTMKPYDLIKRLVECSTVKDDIVLDIFMGTGMTGLVCKNINRHFMGCELDKTFVDKSLIHII